MTNESEDPTRPDGPTDEREPADMDDERFDETPRSDAETTSEPDAGSDEDDPRQ